MVDELTVTLASTGEPVSHSRVWHEPLGGETLEVQENMFATGQTNLNYWVLPRTGNRCLLAGVATWSREGRLVTSDLWLDDPATLRIPGAMRFPQDLYPNVGIPADSFIRALQLQDEQDVAKVNLQISPYSFVTLDTWKLHDRDMTTPGGNFKVEEVAARPSVESILPSWPAPLRAAVRPFFPKLILDYDSTTHNVVKFHGTLGWPAPWVDIILTHRSVVDAKHEPTVRGDSAN